MDEQLVAHPSPGERLRRAWRAARLWLVFLAGLGGTTLAYSLPLSQAQSTLGLAVNDIAPRSIQAPNSLTYTSQALTLESRQAAAEAVADVYDPPDSQVTRQQVERLRATLDFIDAVRADTFATQDQKVIDLAALSDVALDEAAARMVLDLPEARWKAVKLETISVLEQVMRSEIRDSRLEEARRTVPALVSIAMPEGQADLTVQLASAFVAANSQFNPAATEAARELARQAVPLQQKSYAAGETIISGGERVRPEHLEALENFGLLRPPDFWSEVAVRGLLIVVMGSALALYAYRVHPELLNNIRLVASLSILFAGIALAMQFMIPGRTVLPYLYPAATLPMLLAILFSPGMGILSAVVTGALAGFLAPRGLELALFVSLSGALGALMIGQAERLSSFFWAGLAATLAAVAVVVVFRLPDPATDIEGKATLLGVAFINGFLATSLALALVLIISNLLGITTNLQLLDLSRPDQPLLQFILRNAPGTYQHSLQVANLAEQAARAIGANAQLTRVGALYHDAGKALRPQFFIENQIPGQNIHEQLDPATSANVILAHIRDGLELARKHKLPKRIQAFIPEHHGTLEATYQYMAALDAAGEDASRVDRRDFTYPGPRPRSKETALLMLADGVEAKARADMPRSDEDIDQLVRWVIQDRLSKGQLDRTDLTLRDLDNVRRSFVNTLRGIYHPRIRYPEPATEPIGESEPVRSMKPTSAARPKP